MSHRPTIADIKGNLMRHSKQACQLDPRSAVVPLSKALAAVNRAITLKQQEIDKLTKQLHDEPQQPKRTTDRSAFPGDKILGEQAQ